MALRQLFASVALCSLAFAGCRRESARPDRTEPWLASASALPSAGPRAQAPRRVPYVLAQSRIEFELPARHGTPRGRFDKARGALEVDLDDPARSRGNIEIELDSLELFEAGEAGAGASFSARALAWLELGEHVPAERREAGRIATFSLRALQPESEGSRAPEARSLRTGDWSVRGDLALHGVRAPTDTPVSLVVKSTGDGTAAPAELVIRSRRPLVVSLSTHDIRPRDASGVLLPREASLVGDSVGREARVSFELVFVPRS